MGALLNPSTWLGAALVAALAFGGWEYATVKTRDATISALQAAGDKALAEQAVKDAAASAAAQAKLQALLDAANAAVAEAIGKIKNAPVTNSCGPVVRDAESAARRLLNGSGSPDARTH